MKIAHFDLVI